MTDIYIISGFLGAGKTTLIQKLLTESFQGRKVALVENDFGEVSVDAALLKGGGYQVKELNAGCICCSLTGDFIAALSSLLKSYHPEVVLIEPSGVGKLSDVEKACRNSAFTPVARIAGKITVVDVKRCVSYLENFGEFFEDQVAHADTLLFSRVDQFPEQLPEARALVERLNPDAAVFAERWELLPAAQLLGAAGKGAEAREEHDHGVHCACGRHHHEHDGECHHGEHTAKEAFDTLTLRFQRAVPLTELAARLSRLEAPGYGTVLRAKGILRGPDGFLNLQYLPGDLKIEKTDVNGNELCIIGKGLDEAKISAAFADV